MKRSYEYNIFLDKPIFTVLFFIFLITYGIFMSNYSSFVSIYDASVNSETGDIVYVYFADHQYYLKSYDKYGSLLFAYGITIDGGGVHLKHENDQLYVYIGRRNEQRIYDRDGNLISIQYDMKTCDYRNKFTDWESHSGYKCYYLNDTVYRYETSSTFLKAVIRCGENKLTIQKPDGETVEIFRR